MVINMKIKRFAAGALAACIALSGTGCMKKKNSGEVPQVSWYLLKAIDNMSSQKYVEDEVNKILKEKVGAELRLNLLDAGSRQEKMNLIISSGETFDIMMTDPTGPLSLAVNSRRNAFLDLTDLYEKYGGAIKKKIDPRGIEACTVDGKLLLIPSQGKYVGETAYVFKKDLVEKYGFDYKSVTCLEDLEPYLETIKQNEPLVTPLYITANSDLTQPINKKFTGTSISCLMFDEDNEKFVSKYVVNKDEYRLKNKYYNKGYIAKDAFTKQDAAEGKNGRYAVLRDTGAHTEDSSKATAYYGFKTVETLVGTSLIGPTSFSSGNAISVTSKNPDKAMQILNAVWEDPYISNTLAYGVEGVDYEVVSGTTNEDKSVLPNTGTSQKWALWHNWLGPLFDQWDSPWNSKEALMKMEHDNENAETSKAVGFLMDTSKFDAEIAAISEVETAAQTVLRVGNMDNFDEYYADLDKKLDNAGINDLIDDMNKQYAAWKKSKKK